MIDLRIKTEATNEVIDYDFVKNHADMGTLSDNDKRIVLVYIKSAREAIERKYSLSLVQKTYELVLDKENDIYNRESDYLPMVPISSVSSVKKEAMDGTITILTQGTDYYVRGKQKKVIEFIESTVYGSAGNETKHYIIEYVSGYGITGDNATEKLPEEIKIAIAKQVLTWWNNRTSESEAAVIANAETMLIMNKYAWRGFL